MPFDFDPNGNDVDTMEGFDDDPTAVFPEDLDDNTPVPGAPAGYIPDAVVERLLSPVPEEEDYEKVLSQVDRRMRVAHFYRDVLEADLFSEKTAEAKIVQGRIRKFCNDELEVIFGMRSAQVAATDGGQFSVDEVKVLKELIARLTLAETAKQTKSPVKAVNKVQQVQQKAPAVVQIRTQQQSKPPAPAPVAPVPVAPPSPAAKQPPRDPKIDLRIPEQHRNDPTARVVKGKVYIQARDDDQNPLWRSVDSTTGRALKNQVPIMRDVTPIAKPTGAPIQPVAMPSMLGGASSPFSQVMQQHADSTLQMIDRASGQRGVGGNVARQFGGALAISLMNKAGDEDEYER